MLHGLKVIDISSVLAGPLTGTFFAECGATVLKIENKTTGGDVTRQWKLPSETEGSQASAYYFSANYGKETWQLDLSDEQDKALLYDQLKDADVVISNFQKKTAEKLGWVPDEITARFPKLVFAQLSAFEWDDPRPGYDLIMQAETGWISMNGTDVDHLSKLPVALMDILASHQLREGILLALYRRQVSGKGSIVHVSLFKSALTALANQASNYLMTGHIPQPIGTIHPNIMPYGDLFLSGDHCQFLLAVGSDAQFAKMMERFGIDASLLALYGKNQERVANRKQVYEMLQQSFSSFNFAEIEAALNEINLPFCQIKTLDKVFTGSVFSEMVLSRVQEGVEAKSVRTIAFDIEESGAIG